MSQERMLAGFALYQERPVPYLRRQDHDTISTPPGTRLQRIIRLREGWQLWTATADYVYGTYLVLYNDGAVLNCTVRDDEGDEQFWVRPVDVRT